jgi:H+/gluconate symporter-like permease
MPVLVCVLALVLLMTLAYRGHSVILVAPLVAMLAVLATEPSAVPEAFTSLFMEKLVGFVKLYLPVFLLGALFGKLMELAGFSRAIVAGALRLFGAERATLAIVLVSALLTYGGVSLFVVVFAVYPFAAALFHRLDVPKRLIPGTIALGAFTFTMDALPGTPQIQNIIPTAFFHTDAWAAPRLGLAGAAFVLSAGILYLEAQKRRARQRGEGYGRSAAVTEAVGTATSGPHPMVALVPMLVVGLANPLLFLFVQARYGKTAELQLPGIDHPIATDVSKVAALWAVEGALLFGIASVVVLAWPLVRRGFAEGSRAAVAGALLAALNTASEYGFGGVVAALPGFVTIRFMLAHIRNPLVHEAIATTTLAGITGSASGGLSIALAAMSDSFSASAAARHIPPEVLHRVASMASGGMDTLPHNGAVITLLAVTGLTHRESYRDIFVLTCIKTAAVFAVIALYYATGWV